MRRLRSRCSPVSSSRDSASFARPKISASRPVDQFGAALGDFPLQIPVQLGQPGERLVAFELGAVAAGVVADAGDQLNRVGQLDQIIAGSETEGARFNLRLLLRGEHDNGNLPRGGVGAVGLQQREPVHSGHDQILQDYRRAELFGRGKGLQRILAEMEGDVRLGREHLLNGVPDERLVIHEEDARRGAARRARGRRRAGWRRGRHRRGHWGIRGSGHACSVIPMRGFGEPMRVAGGP